VARAPTNHWAVLLRTSIHLQTNYFARNQSPAECYSEPGLGSSRCPSPRPTSRNSHPSDPSLRQLCQKWPRLKRARRGSTTPEAKMRRGTKTTGGGIMSAALGVGKGVHPASSRLSCHGPSQRTNRLVFL
jgi:hypothetical protein